MKNMKKVKKVKNMKIAKVPVQKIFGFVGARNGRARSGGQKICTRRTSRLSTIECVIDNRVSCMETSGL